MITTDTASPEPPVTRAEVRAHLRLSEGFPEDTAEDALLDRLLAAATAQVETRLAQLLVARQVTLAVDRWSASGHLVLPIGPVAAIDSLVLRRGGDTVALDAAGLVIEPGRTRQRVTGPGGAPLPAVPRGWRAEAVFSAGHGATGAEVPDDLRHAVLLLAARHFEDRDGAEGPGLPAPVAALLAPHRPVRL